jgi:hypothetical protein
VTAEHILCALLIATGSAGVWFPTVASRHGEEFATNYEIPGGTLISLLEVIAGVTLAFWLFGFSAGLLVVLASTLISIALIEIMSWHIQVAWIASQAVLASWGSTALVSWL